MIKRKLKKKTKKLKNSWTAIYRVVPDEQLLIERELMKMIDDNGCSVVVTTGGTGPAPRDVTPEATVAVCFFLILLSRFFSFFFCNSQHTSFFSLSFSSQ